jgi:hypothetical protein
MRFIPNTAESRVKNANRTGLQPTEPVCVRTLPQVPQGNGLVEVDLQFRRKLYGANGKRSGLMRRMSLVTRTQESGIQ